MQRSDRVGDEIRKILSSVIQNELKDPRIPELTSVVSVRVTRDLSHAYAQVSVLGSEKAQKECAAALRSANGYIRRELGRRMRLRLVPELHFVLDQSIEKGFEINRLLDEVMGRSTEDDGTMADGDDGGNGGT